MARVLVVDDSPYMKLKYRQLVKECGYEYAGEAESAKEAVWLAADIKPDLIIMDITAQEMDGLETIRAIKELERDIKIIVCSAMGQQHVIVSAIQAGAHDFIVKPFFDSRVVNAMNGLLSER